MDVCSGLITRRRITTEGVEESIIDFVSISNDLKESIVSLHIDEERTHAITKYSKTKNGALKKGESDHNPLLANFNLKWNKRAGRKKIEMFNLKNKECQQIFKTANIKLRFSFICL